VQALAEAGRCGLYLGEGLCHFGGHAVLSAEKFQEGELVLRPLLADERPVAEAEITQLPKNLNIKIAAGAEITEVAV
jgi:hypothetical protein